MGKAAIIMVLGLVVIVGFFNSLIRDRSFEGVANMSGYYSSVTAKNVARSAMENYLKKLYQNKNLRGTFVEKDAYIEGGIDTLIISADSSTTSLGDTIKVSVVAHYGGKKSSIETSLLATTTDLPDVVAAIAFADPNPLLDVRGNPGVDGHNHDMHTGVPDGSCPDLPGVAVASSSDSAGVVDFLYDNGQENRVHGIGPDPSVHIKPTPSPSTFLKPIINQADHYLLSGTYSSLTYGTEENPTIVYGKGEVKFSGGVVGHGILIIDGTLDLSGNFFWYGMIYVIGKEPKLFNSVGTNAIMGGVVLGGEGSRATLKGTPDINYSCEAIQNVKTNTSSLLTFSMVSWYE